MEHGEIAPQVIEKFTLQVESNLKEFLLILLNLRMKNLADCRGIVYKRSSKITYPVHFLRISLFTQIIHPL